MLPSPSAETQPETAAQEGEFCWHELATTASADEAFAAYSALFLIAHLAVRRFASAGEIDQYARPLRKPGR